LSIIIRGLEVKTEEINTNKNKEKVRVKTEEKINTNKNKEKVRS
jgi:hypothetical protein